MANQKQQSNAWYRPRFNASWSWLITFLLILASIRGIIVLHSQLSPATVYQSTAACLIFLSLYGYLKRKSFKNPDLGFLRRLLQLNLLLGIINVALDLLLRVPVDPSSLYVYLAPYVIFVFFRVPSRYLNFAIVVITGAISYSVCDNFFQTLSGPDGLQRVLEYNARLRPEVFGMLSHTGEFYRVGGYTGSYHDSANILGMTASFLSMQFLLKKRILDLGLFLFTMIGLTLTQSAANIVIAIGTILVFAGYFLIQNRRPSTYIYLLLGLAGVVVLIMKFGSVMSIFTNRVGSDADWGGVTYQLNASSLLGAIPFILVGHAAAFGSEAIRTEVSLLKTVFQLGIIHATIFAWLTIYPVLQFVKVRARCSEALPTVAAVVFGFLSLLHYGSLYRVTNVFLFFAFYSMGLVHIINCKRSDIEPVTVGS